MNEHFDKAFRLADEAFAEADRGFSDLGKEPAATTTIDSTGTHCLKFKVTSFRGRLRLAGHFIGLGLRVLWRGQLTLRFKARAAR